MTRLPLPGQPDTLYVWDLSCWVHRYWATMKGRCAHGFLDLLGKVLGAQRPSHAVICSDLPFPNFRHDIAPEFYKLQREPKEATLLERLRWAREMAEDYHGVRVLGVRGFEADDLIAAISRQALAAGYQVVILGLDKDLMQLLDDVNCVMWDGKQMVVGAEEVTIKFGIRPDQLRDYLALVGDAADNVPGVHGLGPKAAVDILTAYDNLDNALKEALGVKATGFFKANPRYRSILREHAETAKLCQRLIALAEDAPVTFDPDLMRCS